MNAEQAKELARKNLRGPVIEPFVKEIENKIRLAAEQGRFNITHPFHGLSKYPPFETQDSIYELFIQRGFKVKHHPNPDPGHPASSDYTEISWN